MMGIISAGSSVWATLCVVLSGIIGKGTWQYAFYLHAFGVVPLLSVFFFPYIKGFFIYQNAHFIAKVEEFRRRHVVSYNFV